MSKNRNQTSKKSHIQQGRERNTFNSAKEAVKSKKSSKETHRRKRNFSQISGSHASRGVYNRDRDKTNKKQTHSATKNTREAKKRLADNNQKKKRNQSKKQKPIAKNKKSKTDNTKTNTHKNKRKKRKMKGRDKRDNHGRGRQALQHTDTQSCSGGTMLVNWAPQKGVHHDDDGHTRA